MLRLAVIFTILAGPALATQEYILPTLFDVTGVAGDDALNIRQSPDAGAEITGTLAPDAKNIEVVAERNGWAQVNAGERSGWVSMRFLSYRTDVWEQGKLPAGFSCYGTEPFWGLTPEGDQLVLSTPEQDRDVRKIQAILDRGIFRHPMRAILADGMTVTASPEFCSDGMSDRVFGLTATIILHGENPQMLAGCCSIQP